MQMRNQIIIPLLTQSPSLHAEDCLLELWNWSDIIFVGKLLYIKGSILQIVWVFTKLIIDGEVIQTILSLIICWWNMFLFCEQQFTAIFLWEWIWGPNCIKWHLWWRSYIFDSSRYLVVEIWPPPTPMVILC